MTAAYLLQQTQAVRGPKADAILILDDTLCEHVGSLFDYVDRHYHHGDATYPLAHNPITSHYVSGPVRFPLDLRLYRRYEELTRWEAFVHKEAVIRHKVPFSVLLFDSWYHADELVPMARYHNKDWISLLKKNRNLKTHSFVLKDAAGQPIPLAGPHIAVADLVPLIPPTAYREVTVGDKTYWTFTLTVRLPGLGKVRLVVSFKSAELTGTAAVLVTKRADWSAQRIVALCLQRWPIEVDHRQERTGTEGKVVVGLRARRKHLFPQRALYRRLLRSAICTVLPLIRE